jgi:16S rRNA (guanine966-N2)-methyltransferase
LRPAGKSGGRTERVPRRASAARVLRIIGGTWRGRKLRFPQGPDIRPTPDRVRETLFNWLGPRVAGARCLDLFAGSGALGLEALSRGAAHVTFIEHEPRAAHALSAHLAEWGAAGARVQCQDALGFLRGTVSPCDIAFLDPPFASGLIGGAAELLAGRGWLTQGARVYVECAAGAGAPELPASLVVLKSKRAGEVGYHLYEYLQAAAD